MDLRAGPGGVGTLLPLKVVPGASRSRVVGPHGDALRVQVAAPPERGKANDAVRELLAEALRVRRSDIEITQGAGSPRKIAHVRTLSPDEVAARLARGAAS